MIPPADPNAPTNPPPPMTMPAAAQVPTEVPPSSGRGTALKLDDLVTAIRDQNSLLQSCLRELHEPDGALARLDRKVEQQALAHRAEMGKLREDLLCAVLRGANPDQITSPLSVLVVDDVPDVVEVLATVLRSAGVTVHTAFGGEQALEVLRSDTPIDVVLSDLNMPGNGTGLLAHVREDHPRVEVVVMTGYEGRGASYALEHGAHGFLAKPFRGDEVVLAVTRAGRYRRIRTGQAP